MNYGDLHLIPKNIGEEIDQKKIDNEIISYLSGIQYWMVENIKTTRRFLKKIDKTIIIDNLHFIELNKKKGDNEIDIAIKWLMNGNDVGLMSEAGLPGIADPGNSLVLRAHVIGIRVIPHSGPSSILLGLIASGLSGQKFTFNGYLPVKKTERINKLKQLEKDSFDNRLSHIFMETPYRNNSLLDSALKCLKSNTWFCIACDIDSENQFIQTKRVNEWKTVKIPDLHKRPAVFILQGFDN